MRGGYRVIDTDSHVTPAVELLYEQGGPGFRGRWEDLKAHLRLHHELRPWAGDWERPWLELAVAPYSYEGGHRGNGRADRRGGQPASVEVGVLHDNAPGRLRAMDEQGIDCQLILPGGVTAAGTGLDDDLSTGLLEAYNRYALNYAEADPSRLKVALQVHGGVVDWSVAEIRRHAAAAPVAGVTVCMPAGLRVDDPALGDIWRAMEEADLPLVHHAFPHDTPYFPGYREVAGSPAVAAAVAAQWSAQAVLGGLVLGGVLDRHTSLRVLFGDTGAGWLGPWLHHLRGHAMRAGGASRDPVDHAAGGRVCVGIEPHEGEAVAKSLIGLIGDDALVWQSHFPSSLSGLESSPDTPIGWTRVDRRLKEKILAGNAQRCLRLV
jgi:predicted TIM-barrel fold metal-dependent hydrolase